MSTDSDGLRANGVTFGYGDVEVVRRANLTVRRGQMVVLAGPNGSGKTTLLRLLSGLLRPAHGSIDVDGADLLGLTPRERARRIAVVAQRADPGMLFTVGETVALGRTPYARFMGSLSPADRNAIREALEATEVAHLRDRRLNELSGGELQRVMLAMALAQGGTYLLLDEPTTHLDLHHQHEVLELLSRLRATHDVGILAVLHDLNLAALYFDGITLMNAGSVVLDGGVRDVLHDPRLPEVFRAPLCVVDHPRLDVPQVLLDRRESGETVPAPSARELRQPPNELS